MSLDSLMYEWVKTQISSVVRLSDRNINTEPPHIQYLPTRFVRQNEGGSAESYPGVQVRIRIETNSDNAYDGSGDGPLDTAADSVISDLAGQVPSLSGYVATPMTLAVKQPAVANNTKTYREIVFLTTIAKGFAVAPVTGSDGSVSIVGLDGQALGYQVTNRCPADHSCSSDTQTIETVSLGMPRLSGTIDWIAADSSSPMPVVGSSVSVVFAVNESYAWVDTIKIAGYSHRVAVRDEINYQVIRIQFHVDSPTSPFFTGVAA